MIAERMPALSTSSDRQEVVEIEDRDGGVSIIRMVAGENRLNPDMISGLEAALDAMESREGPLAVVLTGEGKFFSNGLDLEWLGQADDIGRRQTLARVYALLARLLEFPAPVVSAINGHCFAAGAMMALAGDWRVMREDRGFFCLPEVDIGLVFVPGMNSLITRKLSGLAARDTMLTGNRLGGPEALTSGVVDRTAAEDRVIAEAVEMVAPLASKSREVFGGIKRGINAAAIESLRAEAESTLGD